jgi:hypothetical protein
VAFGCDGTDTDTDADTDTDTDTDTDADADTDTDTGAPPEPCFDLANAVPEGTPATVIIDNGAIGCATRDGIPFIHFDAWIASPVDCVVLELRHTDTREEKHTLPHQGQDEGFEYYRIEVDPGTYVSNASTTFSCDDINDWGGRFTALDAADAFLDCELWGQASYFPGADCL